MTTGEFHRKLTAILSADVVGYSRLMGDDEASTVKTLETYKGVMSSLIRQHRGRVVDSPGDNLLAEFGSVVDAVQCAVSIQKELQARNGDLPENRRMEFRIGINLGDVIEEEDRIYGDGVNIAARLETLADPGGICISKTAFDYIENKLPFGYRFIGEQTVKNIARPVGAYRVLMETRVVDAKTKGGAKAVSFWQSRAVLSLGIIVILAIAAVLSWIFYLHGPSIEPASVEPEQVPAVSEEVKAKKTIAVLPFADMSAQKDQEYFVDGLSEEILNTLAKIPDLGVTARTSSFSFKDKSKTVQEIASVLGVENILEGSVRKSGSALRITAQLIRAKDGFHLWSETYDRELKDIFAVQEDIAKSVTEELKATLGVGKSLKELGGTQNEKAYEELYMIAKGQYRKGPELVRSALVSIDEALKIDPKFALGWALKANIHEGILKHLPEKKQRTLELEKGLQAAKKAIELEPNMAAGYFALGHVRDTMGEWINAQLAFRKSLELTTDPSQRHELEYPIHYEEVGHLERAKSIFQALLINDPLNGNFRGLYIVCLSILGDTTRCLEEYERGKVLHGDQWGVSNDDVWGISLVRISTGNSVSSSDLPYSSPVWDAIKKHLDSQEVALRELHKIYAENNKLTSWDFEDISIWAAYYGDPTLAMEALEKTINDNSTEVAYFWLPIMKEVRQLPRFKEFVKKIGLVDYWKEFGWPDICRPLDNGDFVCD